MFKVKRNSRISIAEPGIIQILYDGKLIFSIRLYYNGYYKVLSYSDFKIYDFANRQQCKLKLLELCLTFLKK